MVVGARTHAATNKWADGEGLTGAPARGTELGAEIVGDDVDLGRADGGDVTPAAATDLVVHLGMDAQGVRRVNEIVSVPGRVENDIIETEPIFHRTSAGLQRLHGSAPRLDQFERAGIDIAAILSGDD